MPKTQLNVRRPRKSGRRMRRRKLNISRLPLTGFPKRSQLVRLRYCQEVAINPPAAGIAAHVFRANSLFDPDLTTTGHQPQGFDQWMLVYHLYTVVGSKITIRNMNETSAHDSPFAYTSIVVSSTGTRNASYTNVEHLLEDRSRKAVTLSGAANPGYKATMMQTRTFSTKKHFGVSSVVGQEFFSGNSVSNPIQAAYFEVCCASPQGADPAGQAFLVEIEYLAVFTEPRLLVQS